MLGHDLTVNNVRMAFNQWNVGQSWKSGHYLKHVLAKKRDGAADGKDNIPDWICALKAPKGFYTTALEVELHLKSRTRRVDILRSYAKKDAIQFIWYVFPRERFGEALFESCEGVLLLRPKGWVCWSLLEEVLGDLPNAKMHFPSMVKAVSDVLVIDKTGADTAAVTASRLAKPQESLQMK